MSPTENSDLLTRVRSENRGRNFVPPLTAAAGVLAVGLFLATGALLLLAPPRQHQIVGWLLAATPLLAAGVAVTVYLRRREDRSVTAARIDRERHGMNRLEAAVELARGSHPFKDAQAREAAGYYARQEPARWGLRLALLGLLLAVLMTVDSSWWVATRAQAARFAREAAAAADSAREAAGTPAAAAPQAAPAPETAEESAHAELLLVDPEPEIKAKPQEEIAWKGAGAATRGFTRMDLEIAVNGDAPKRISVPVGQFRRGDPQEFAGALRLEDLKLEPFDLVTYNLRGMTRLDGTADREVTSLPQFIEIVPRREEIDVMRGGGSGMRNILDEVLKWLRLEIAMNKTTYAAGNAAAGATAAAATEIREQMDVLVQDQQRLAEEVKTTAETLPPGAVPEEILSQITLAEGDMRQAATRLQAAAAEAKLPGLDTAGQSQQRAIADLVAALKAARRAIILDAEAAAQREQDPFRDRNPPPLPPDAQTARLDKKLAQLRAAETEILKAMTPSSSSSAPASGAGSPSSPSGQAGQASSPSSQLENQEKVSEGIAGARNLPGQDTEMRDTLAHGAESSAAAEQALGTDQAATATAAVKKTLADLDAAATHLADTSNRSAAAAIAQARRQLEAGRAGLEQNAPEVAAANALRAMEVIASEARWQAESGTEARFREFAGRDQRWRQDKLPEQLRDVLHGVVSPNAASRLAETLGRMDAELRGMQDGSGGPVQALAAGVKHLKDSQDELGFLQKNPAGASPRDRAAATADARLALRDTLAAMNAVAAGQAGSPPPSTADAPSPTPGKTPGQAPGSQGAAPAQGTSPGQGKGQGQDGKGEGQAPGQGQGQTKQGDGTGGGSPAGGRGAGRYQAALYSADVTVLLDGVKELRVEAERLLADQQSQTPARVFNPEEAPAEYRGDVSRYFERLSDRDTKKP